MKWMERIQENAQASSEYPSEEEKSKLLKTIEAAYKVYEQLAK